MRNPAPSTWFESLGDLARNLTSDEKVLAIAMLVLTVHFTRGLICLALFSRSKTSTPDAPKTTGPDQTGERVL